MIASMTAFADALQAKGRYTFTLTEAMGADERSAVWLYSQIISQFTDGLLMLCRRHAADIQELPLDGRQVLNACPGRSGPIAAFLP